ncbi:MAG: ferrous iron transport protein A [Thermoanaerobacteraceae bacterium]|nr:ferrous iron transport protein A [Thermoanaerobacteraceae bacterium]
MKEKMPLSELPVGQWGRVVSLQKGDVSGYRLLDLGLVPGTAVQAVRRSPVGDPTAYHIRGALIALRREEAARVMVKPLA